MASFEKVDAVIVGAGAAGAVFAAVLTRAGKKVVLLEQGPDWQLTDLISSDIWGRRLKGSGAPIIYEGRNAVGRTSDHGWGVGGAALHYSANFPRLLPADFKVKSRARPRARLADLLCRHRALLRPHRARDRRLRRRQGGGALAPAWRALSDAAAQDLPAWRGLGAGLQVGRHHGRARRRRGEQHRVQGPRRLHP